VLIAGLAALTRLTGGEAANDTPRIQTLGGDDDVAAAPSARSRSPVRGRGSSSC
jgi:hypothetical protein